MQRHALTGRRYWRWGGALALALLALWARALLWSVVLQLFFGMLAAIAALPLMKRLEKRLSPGLSASISMTALGAALLGAAALAVPFLAEQARQLAAYLPTLIAQAEGAMEAAQAWLRDNGVAAELPGSLGGAELLSSALPAAMDRFGGAAESLGKILLAPMFAFYFLRDRKQIGVKLLLCVPEGWRGAAVKALREMRREAAGFVRGQLMVSAIVGVMTAVGLLLCGVPGWLLLGAVMGVLELIPYIGPFLGGVLVLLFALPGGITRTLWAMGVVLAVQQIEGGMLSPQLMSGATRLHPVWVLLCLMVGGAAGGVLGILFSVPLFLCARAAARVISLQLDQER